MGNCFSNNTDKNKKTLQILYVEDVFIHFSLLQLVLQKHYTHNEVELIHTSSVKESYKYIQENQVDLILLDRFLVEEKGDDLIELLKEDNLFPLNRIVIISANENPNDIEKFTKDGVVYFTKPLQINKFIEKINSIL